MKKLKALFCITSALVLSSISPISANAVGEADYDEEPTIVKTVIQGIDGPSASDPIANDSGVNYYAVPNTTDGFAVSAIYDKCDVVDTSYFGTTKVDVYGTVSSELVFPSSGTADGIPDWTMTVMCQLYVSNASTKYTNSPTKTVYNSTYVYESTKTVQGKDWGRASCTGYHTVKDYYGNIIHNNETFKEEGI